MEHKWPTYETGPEDSINALGVVSINYTRFERALAWLFCAVGELSEQEGFSLVAKLGNPDRAKKVEVLLSKARLAEIKKVGVTIGSDQKQQSWKYVKELMEKGLLTETSEVTCFVLGSKVDLAESGQTTHANGRVVVWPMAYDVFIRRAERRMLGLRDKLRDAPFLQGHDLDGHPTIFQKGLDIDDAASVDRAPRA